MDVRLRFIGIQNEGVAVLTPEFLTGEISTAPKTFSGGVPAGIEKTGL
jgi:hypothetical protein